MGKLGRYLTGRLVKAAITVLAVLVMNFVLVRLAPGDPASVMAGEAGAADAKFVAQLREQFGLDRPLHEQLWIYMRGIVQLDLGYSPRQQRPVSALIAERLPGTLLLTGGAFVLALGGGVALGALAATRVGTVADSLITALALLAYATPIFWVGLMLVLLFSVLLGWLPSLGMATVGAKLTGLAHIGDVAAHLVLPATTLGLFFLAIYARLTRAEMLEVADQDFVKTARAKGVREGRITRVHVLRNALLPVVTFAGIQAGQLIGGSILVETVFAWPGIGRLMFEALLQRDYNLLLGVFLFTAAMVVLFNLLTDMIYTIVDPRIELR